MIYLIGGPPKCGKTTFAKKLSQRLGISYVSTDSLQNVIVPYLPQEQAQENFPVKEQRRSSNDEKFSEYSREEIVSAYKQQARFLHSGIESFLSCEVADGSDCILEGYHIEPELFQKLYRKYGESVKAYFFIKKDKERLVESFTHSTTPNDWIISKTEDDNKTFPLIADMICYYSAGIEEECKKYKSECIDLSEGFSEKAESLVKSIAESKRE